jgi:hypothetical protein
MICLMVRVVALFAAARLAKPYRGTGTVDWPVEKGSGDFNR